MKNYIIILIAITIILILVYLYLTSIRKKVNKFIEHYKYRRVSNEAKNTSGIESAKLSYLASNLLLNSTKSDDNQTSNNMINQHKVDALESLNTNDIVDSINDMFDRRGEPRRNIGVNAMVIINDVFDHAVDNRNTLLAVEAADKRNIAIKSRQDIIFNQTKKDSNLEKSVTFLQTGEQNTNDLQNTHDTGVLANLRGVIMRLRESSSKKSAENEFSNITPNYDDVINEIIKFMNDNLWRFSKSTPNKVKQTLETIKNGNTAIALKISDKEALYLVWQRIKDPKNSSNALNMKEALIHALKDCVEHDNVVCVNGRIAQIFGSLVLLDYDKRNWGILKLEQHKNEIYQLAANLIKESINKRVSICVGDDKIAAQAYQAQNANDLSYVNPVAEEKLKVELKGELLDMIDNYVKEANINSPNIFPPPQISAIKIEVAAAV